MALLDLSLVTRCFTTLLGQRLPTYPVWPAANNLLASGGPPDLVNAPHGLSFYLYHALEDAHLRNQDWSTNEGVPQRFGPMGLRLFYLLTPRSNLADANQRALAEQLVFGLALKTLHDMPLIDDSSTVLTSGGPVLVMPPGLRGRDNRLRISLQPTPVNEASQYWQAGSQPLRLAAYYEVAATLIEPDEATTRRGRVLMVGVHSFVRGQPRIEATHNRLSFTVPFETTSRELDLSPAEVAYGQTLDITGADLKGDDTQLLLNHRDFAEPVPVDTSWNLFSDGSRVSVTVRATAGAQALPPGVYGAVVRTTARRTLPDGSQRDFDADSNESAFVIAPRITTLVEAAGLFTVTVDGFEPHTLAAADLLVFVGANRLTRSNAAPAAGQFFAPAAPAAARVTVRLRLPTGGVPGSVLPLRLIVRGAESQPFWVTVP